MQAWGKLCCSWGLFIAGWFGCCLTARETVWSGSYKAFLWIKLVLSEKENEKRRNPIKKIPNTRLLVLEDVRHLFLFIPFWNGY